MSSVNSSKRLPQRTKSEELVGEILEAQSPTVQFGGAPTIAIHCPLGEAPAGGYLSSHVEAKLTTPQQMLAMRRLQRGLEDARATLADGRPIVSYGDCIRWILEQISEPEIA